MRLKTSEETIFAVLSSLFICFLFAQIGFLFSVGIQPFYYPVSVLLSLAIFCRSIKAVAFSLLIIAFSLVISGLVFDFSADGQTYHQEMMIQLAKGWIPNDSDSASRTMKVWVDHYPKGAECIQAGIYSFFKMKELGKATNIMLMAVSFLFIRNSLGLLPLSRFKVYLYSFFAAANPVVLSQVFTYYLDGLFYSFIISFLCSLFLYIKTQRTIYLLPLTICFVLGSSLKFTSFPVFALLSGGVILILLFSKKIESFKKISIALIIGFCIIAVGNYNPYITNLKAGKHIFYPLRGDGAIDILERFAPPGFVKDNNRVEKLMFTLFTKTGSFDPAHVSYKIPFSISKKELNRLADSDIGVGGFGIFYGGLLIVLLIVIIFNIRKFKKLTFDQKLLIAGIFPLILSIAIISDPWWVRYIPQFYLIPLLIMLVMEINEPKVKGLILPKAVLFVNVMLFIAALSLINLYNTLKTNYILSALQKSNQTVYIDAHEYSSNLERLGEHQIKYKQVEIKKDAPHVIRFHPKGAVIDSRNIDLPPKKGLYKILNKYLSDID